MARAFGGFGGGFRGFRSFWRAFGVEYTVLGFRVLGIWV